MKYIVPPASLALFALLFAACGLNKDKSASEAESNTSRKFVTLEDKRKAHICTQRLKASRGSSKEKEAFGYEDLFYPPTVKVLKVQFVDGSPSIQSKVKVSAKKWEPYCGIVFQFGKFDTPDITISFSDIGSWSYIGTESRNHVPSMNFGWFDEATTPQEYDRVVLHEFGHALGLYHEHQSPFNNPIQWDTAAVLAYYQGPPNNWTKENVYEQVISVESVPHFKGTSFDKKSIMLYDTPPEFTLNGFHSEPNYRLSKGDIDFIGTIYPYTINFNVEK